MPNNYNRRKKNKNLEKNIIQTNDAIWIYTHEEQKK